MSLDDLANAVMLDSETLAEVEQGHVDTAYSMLSRILNPLGHTVHDLAIVAEHTR